MSYTISAIHLLGAFPNEPGLSSPFHDTDGNQPFHSLHIPRNADPASFFFSSEHLTPFSQPKMALWVRDEATTWATEMGANHWNSRPQIEPRWINSVSQNPSMRAELQSLLQFNQWNLKQTRVPTYSGLPNSNSNKHFLTWWSVIQNQNMIRTIASEYCGMNFGYIGYLFQYSGCSLLPSNYSY